MMQDRTASQIVGPKFEAGVAGFCSSKLPSSIKGQLQLEGGLTGLPATTKTSQCCNHVVGGNVGMLMETSKACLDWQPSSYLEGYEGFALMIVKQDDRLLLCWHAWLVGPERT